MGMIFGMWMCFGDRLLIFVKSGSKVKGQGQKSIKICLFWVDFGHRGYIWDYSEPRRVGGGGTIGSMPYIYIAWNQLGIVPWGCKGPMLKHMTIKQLYQRVHRNILWTPLVDLILSCDHLHVISHHPTIPATNTTALSCNYKSWSCNLRSWTCRKHFFQHLFSCQ